MTTSLTHSRASFDDIKAVVLAFSEGHHPEQISDILDIIKWFMDTTGNRTLRLRIIDILNIERRVRMKILMNSIYGVRRNAPSSITHRLIEERDANNSVEDGNYKNS